MRTRLNAIIISILGFFCQPSLMAADLAVIAGGRGSCALAGDPDELSMWPYAAERLTRDMTVIRACFGIDRHEVIYDVLRYRNGWVVTDTGRALRDAAIAEISDIIVGRASGRITLLGQSYGGWLVANIALQLDSPATTLITVDPISPQECGTFNFLFRGCRGFPADINNAYRSTSFAGEWVNYYQTQYTQLSSGDTPYADENIHLRYRSSGGVFGAHKATESDLRVWERFGTLIAR